MLLSIGGISMKIRYFEDTDTLWIELTLSPSVETRDLDENTLLELDAKGGVCAITSSMRRNARTCRRLISSA